MRFRHWVEERLHRRIFVWFGAAIVMTGATVTLVLMLAVPESGWQGHWARLRRFVGQEYARTWDDPVARDELARSMSRELSVDVVLHDAAGRPIGGGDPGRCRTADLEAPVVRDGRLLGSVSICGRAGRRRPGWLLALGIAVACATLWAFSGIIARRLGRPIGHVAAVAHDIGQGKLQSRVRLGRHRIGELATLADAVNEMASRIERQLRDQRELLAAVSHEIRTPLGHIRILLDGARERAERAEPPDPRALDEIEREVLEIDDLVGELLASSRLSFDTLERRRLDARDLGARALERAGLPDDRLRAPPGSLPIEGDPTLLGRALANLIDNATRHGGGVERLEISTDQSGVTFAVDDRGPGFGPAEIDKVFDPFYRGENRAGAGLGSLGLGLSLVRRIAVAHGGRAWAANREGGGARVAIRVAAPGT